MNAAAAISLDSDAARKAVLLDTLRASRGLGQTGWIEREGRASWACRILAERTDDADLIDPAIERGDECAIEMARLPAAGMGDIVIKLAQLVADRLRDVHSDATKVQQLMLAASALADAVVLASGPVTLPAGTAAGAPPGASAAEMARHAA